MSFLISTASALGNYGLSCLLPASLRALEHLAAGARITRSISTAQRASTGLAFSSCSAPAAAAAHGAWRRLPPYTRGFSASACSSVAADASLSDVIAQVQSCVATSNKETGVLSQLADCAMNRAGELSPDQIRNLTVSFAQLGYFNTQFKSIMADAIIEKLEHFDPAVLADTAWAFGEAQYYDYDLMSTLLPYLKSNIQKFDASGMAKMLWTFARFGYQDETLMDMMHDIALKLQANCNSKSLAEVVYAMAQLGWADSRLHSLVAEYAMDNIQDFDSQGLAKLAFGLAAVGYDDTALYTAITQAATAQLEGMSPADVSMILWACGEQGHLCDKFMSAVADQYMPANMEYFSPQQLQIAVKAWNKLGFSSPAVAAAAVRLSEVLPHLAPDFPDGIAVAAAMQP